MTKQRILLAIALAGLSLGIYYAASGFDKPGIQRKPASYAVQSQVVSSTRIVLKTEYIRCGHVIISDYDKKELKGKTLDEIKALYTEQEGFKVTLANNILTIYSRVDDWCQRDKERCRLKEYQGMLAVYQGPDPDHDFLLRVTSIRMDSLPPAVQRSVRENKYEFETEEALNDALENLDEYL